MLEYESHALCSLITQSRWNHVGMVCVHNESVYLLEALRESGVVLNMYALVEYVCILKLLICPFSSANDRIAATLNDKCVIGVRHIHYNRINLERKVTSE